MSKKKSNKGTGIPKKKVVSYMRYSSDNQNENSISYQRSRNVSYAATHGMYIVKEYVDEACTGTNDRRPAFQRMIADAKCNPEWDTILVFNTSRFFRNSSEAHNYRGLLKKHGIKIISVTQEFDDSPSGILMESISYALDAYSSNVNALHTHSGMREKAKEASHCGGKPPLGFDLDDNKKLIINPEEAEIVRGIFEMYASGFSYASIAKELNSRGYLTKNGSPFGKNSFSSILRQRKYIGEFSWNKAREKDSQDRHNSHAYKPVDEHIVVPGGCPAIISEELFNKVQDMLSDNCKKSKNAKPRNHYMLSGLDILRCSECGAPLVGNPRTSHGSSYPTYSCPNHRPKKGNIEDRCSTKDIRTSYLDYFVSGLIVKDLFNRGDVEELSKLINNNDEQEKILDKIRGKDKSITNTMKAIDISPNELLIQKLNSLTAEKAALEQELAKHQSRNLDLSEANIRKVCNALGKHLCTSNDLETKNYIKSIIDEITVGNDSVSIKLNIA